MKKSLFCKKCIVSAVCREACNRIVKIHKTLKIVGVISAILFIFMGVGSVVLIAQNFRNESLYLMIILELQVVLTIIIMVCIKLKSTLDIRFDLNNPYGVV
jgi:hypothetical protein